MNVFVFCGARDRYEEQKFWTTAFSSVLAQPTLADLQNREAVERWKISSPVGVPMAVRASDASRIRFMFEML